MRVIESDDDDNEMTDAQVVSDNVDDNIYSIPDDDETQDPNSETGNIIENLSDRL